MIGLFADTCNTATGNGLICADKLPHNTNPSLTPYFNIAFGLLGAIAFLMVVIAGLRYITASAQGDATKVAESRKMIIYAIVGIVVASLAAAIVNFVLGQNK